MTQPASVPERHTDVARSLVLSGEQRDRVRRIEGLLYGGGAGHPEGDVWFLLHMVNALVMRLAAVELEKHS